jgi:2-oxoglutarate dehydrogenase E2 component (dihydrolipoamide succinyltransferase)
VFLIPSLAILRGKEFDRMAVELTVPQVGESITEVQVGRWLKQEGDPVTQGETLVEIETDKVTVELPAPVSGRLARILKGDGAAATVAEVIGYLEEAEAPAAGPEPTPAAAPPEKPVTPPAEPEAPPREPRKPDHKTDAGRAPAAAPAEGGPARDVGPAAARTPEAGRMAPAAPHVGAAPVAEKQIVKPPGPPAGLPRISREAVPVSRPAPAAPVPPPPPEPVSAGLSDAAKEEEEREAAGVRPVPPASAREEQVVPMSPLRRRIAQRLVEAQQTAALLTTFNEADMSAVMSLRARYQQSFQERHGIKLGLMSFFVKAAIDALKRFPQLNAEIRSTDMVFRNHYDIGVAVSTDKGLVVPVLANAERMSFAEIELAVADFATRARENKLKLSELEGGTFTITNGGVFGSLLSTPIVNPPQSGILGLHAIQDRPMARDGQVVIRPMMYLALTYDHRIVDGREAVLFLRRIKEVIEEPSRMLIEI